MLLAKRGTPLLGTIVGYLSLNATIQSNMGPSQRNTGPRQGPMLVPSLSGGFLAVASRRGSARLNHLLWETRG